MILKRQYPILISLLVINGYVLFHFIQEGDTMHGIGYFLFFWTALFFVHYFTRKLPTENSIEVKEPKREWKTVLFFSLLGVLMLSLNFYLRSLPVQPGALIRLPIVAGIFLFTFPVGIAIYLLRNKYSIAQLGLRFKPLPYLLLGVLVSGITGLFAFLFNPDGILWARAYVEFGGVAGMLLEGLISAALAEEFSRYVIQTRLDQFFHRTGFHLLIATSIWAFMHFPVTISKGASVLETTNYCIQIIPLGFVWGYMTHRCKSILPAVIAHGLNLWGLQNGG